MLDGFDDLRSGANLVGLLDDLKATFGVDDYGGLGRFAADALDVGLAEYLVDGTVAVPKDELGVG